MKSGFLLLLGWLILPSGSCARLQYLPGPSDGRTPLPNEFRGGEWGSVPGEAGIDYPTYSEVPITSFTCEGKAAGYYADPETRCQTFHVCGGSSSNSFLCPNGTLFNTAVRTCDWWPAVDCGSHSLDIVRTKQKTNEVSTSQPNRRPSKAAEEEIEEGPSGGNSVKAERRKPLRKQSTQTHNPTELRPSTLRRTPRPLTVTRFDFTSETLEFPSMRTTPSRSSLNRGKNLGTSENNRQSDETQNGPSRRRKYKASRLVTPSTTRLPLRGTRPQPLRVAENYPADVFEGFDNYIPSPRKPAQFTQNIPLEVTTPRTEQNYLPESDGRLFKYPITTEAVDEAIRPIVVASADRGSTSYSIADANAFSQYNLGHSSNEFKPPTNAKETSFSQASISEERVTPAFTRHLSATKRAEEPSVTRNPQIFTNSQNVNNAQSGLGSGLTNTLSSTQSSFVIPQHENSEKTYFTKDNSKSITPQQSTSLEPLQKTESHGETRIIQNPTTGAFHIPHSTSEERTPAEIDNLQSVSKGNSHTSPRPNFNHDPTTTDSTKSFSPSQETPRSSTRYNPTTIDGSPTQPAEMHSLQQNNGFTGTTQLPSEADSNELFEEKEEFSPPPLVSGQFSSAQAISGPFNFNNNFGSYPFAFANSLANSFFSNVEIKPQTTASPIASSSLSTAPPSEKTVPQSTVTQGTFPGPTDYQRRPSQSNSFASANAFVSDEGYPQLPTTPSPTSSTSKSPKELLSTTFKTTSTSRQDYTTPKLLYTPTVPQTTARPLSTATPPKKSFSTSVTSSPKTTAFVPRIPFFDSQNIPNTTTKRPTVYNPTTTPSTTKKLKGFYITHPPPTRSTSAKVPMEQYLPRTPTSTYSYLRPSWQIPDSYDRPVSSVDSVKSVSHTLNPSNLTDHRPISTNQPVPPTGGTTEPSFVIQKSVELFAAHEVAFHPSVFSQSSFQSLVPPPFLVPSPKARGFEKWNTEDHTDKLTHPRGS